MAKQAIKGGTTSVSVLLFLQDSASTTGAGKTGLAYNTAGLSVYYVRPGSAAAAVSLVTQTVTGAWSSGGFVEIDATNMPGWYRLDVPNAVVASGVRSVGVSVVGTGVALCPLELQLDAVDYSDATRFGLSALPNAAAGASGGLPTGDGSGRVTVATNADKTGYSLSVTPPTAVQVRQEIDSNSTQLAAITTKTTNLPADPASQATVLAAIPSAASVAAAVGSLVVEGSYSLLQILRGVASACMGKSTNGGLTYRDTSDSKNRITATTDGGGNRTLITLDLS